MKENKIRISNKSSVVLKTSLIAALLIGLAVFVANVWSVRAYEPCPPEAQTLGVQPSTKVCNTNADCGDGNPCTDDVCVCTTYCKHTNKPDETSCDDELYCSNPDTCTAGVCGGPAKDCSYLDDQCQDGVCDENLNACVPDYTNYPLSTPCEDDELFCSLDHCDGSGNCIFWKDYDCSDGVGCTVDTCDEAKDKCVNTPDDSYCDDCLYCNGLEWCDSKKDCQPGTLIDCSDNDLREIATCDWIPDDYHPTWDYALGFTSVCDEAKDECTTGTQTITHTCADNDMFDTVPLGSGCDAECDENQDCPCPKDTCVDSYWYDYPGFGICKGDCTCDDSTECEGPCEPTKTNCSEQNPGTGYCRCDCYPYISHNGEDTISCDDGYDNDCDGYTDCYDPDCDVEKPKTEKTYGTPTVVSGNYRWITSDTEITLDAKDNGGICPSGVDKIKWRVTKLDISDQDCIEECDYTGSGSWNEEGDKATFKIGEDSCHLIEFYSLDNFGNQENTHKQCVFVDNQPPVLTKIVGEPNAEWDGKDSKFYPGIGDLCWNNQENEIECWKVTKETVISMSCQDPNPHPVGIKELCYKVDLDGKDATEQYCNNICPSSVNNCNGGELKEGWCCIQSSEKNLNFLEDSEHNLKFYCVDKLDNEALEDEEKFKVGGSKFTIELNDKWNLISVPFVLFSNDPKDIFEDIKNDVLEVLTYDAEDPDCAANDGWCVYIPITEVGTIKHIKPGWGYWVLTKKDTTLIVVGSLMHEGELPPSRSLVKSWNLIGYYGTDGLSIYDGPNLSGDGREAFCALHSLVNLGNPIPIEWDALITYWKGSFIDLNACKYMNPGAGYWIGMNVADSDYRYTTDCSGNTC
jgi:hypothetical protein